MIARLWSARTTPKNWPRYEEHFTKNVLPELRAVDGYVSVRLLNRTGDDDVEVLVITFWRSFAAIDAFAGADREAAVSPIPPRPSSPASTAGCVTTKSRQLMILLDLRATIFQLDVGASPV